jgi:hypothetical protein
MPNVGSFNPHFTSAVILTRATRQKSVLIMAAQLAVSQPKRQYHQCGRGFGKRQVEYHFEGFENVLKYRRAISIFPA